MKSQSQATIDITIDYCDKQGYNATPFETNYNNILTQQDRQCIAVKIFQGLKYNTISMTNKSKQKFYNDDNALKRYAIGLLNDRLRKAKALNGNKTYEPKEPGKIINNRDEQLMALNQILSLTTTSIVNKQVIQNAIKTRKKQILAKLQSIDYNALPQDLRIKLNI